MQHFPTSRLMSLPKHSTRLTTMLRRMALMSLLSLPPAISVAVALGEVTVRSALGQRLEAELDITSLSSAEAESLAVRLAPPEMFAEAGLDYGAVQRSLRLSIDKRGDRHLIRLSSELAVNEPFLMLLIEVRANGNRTVRQYALLLDPPAIAPGERTAAADRNAADASNVEAPVIAAPQSSSPEAREPARPNRAAPGGNVADRTAAPSQPDRSPTRVVRRGDTLAAIARESLPPGTSLDQALVAYLRANPTAFNGHNIHRMKTGIVLRVPDAEAIAAVPAAEARRDIVLQTRDFHRHRESLARSGLPAADAAPTAPAATAPGTRSRSGTVGVQERGQGITLGGRDQLRLDAAGGEASGPGGPASNGAVDRIAREKALGEANSRIAELEKNIADMQQQMAVRNQSLAEAQQRAQVPAARPGSEAAPAPAPSASPSVSPATDAAASAATPAQPAPAPEAAPATSTALTATPSTPDPIKPAPAKAPALVEDDSVAGLLERLQQKVLSDPISVLGPLGALLAGLVLLGLRSRMKKRSAPVTKTEPNVQEHSVFGQAGGRSVDTSDASNSVFHSNFVPSVSQLDANEVDAIAEADVYIAYGRDEQAEEILLDALRQHPERHPLRVKLLEIYLARKDQQKFGAVAAELRVLTHGHGAEWSQAALMGQQLDPGNLLYGGAAPSPVTPSSPPTLSSEPAASTLASTLAPTLTTSPPVTTLATGTFAPVSSAQTSPVQTGDATANASKRSFAPSRPANDADELPPSSADPISASAGIGALSSPPVSSVKPPMGLVRPDESPPAYSAVEDFGLQLEGLLDERRKEAGSSLSLAPIDPALGAPSGAPSGVLSGSQSPDASPERPALGDFQLSGIGPEVPVTPASSDALALKTKIDLALACHESGDKEAARGLLAEVAIAPHAELSGRAQSLLRQLA